MCKKHQHASKMLQKKMKKVEAKMRSCQQKIEILPRKQLLTVGRRDKKKAMLTEDHPSILAAATSRSNMTRGSA